MNCCGISVHSAGGRYSRYEVHGITQFAAVNILSMARNPRRLEFCEHGRVIEIGHQGLVCTDRKQQSVSVAKE
jgi:hypothetical protein